MAKCKYSLRFEVVVIFPELQWVCPFQRAGLKLRTAQFPTLIVLFHRSECNILDIGKKKLCAPQNTTFWCRNPLFWTWKFLVRKCYNSRTLLSGFSAASALSYVCDVTLAVLFKRTLLILMMSGPQFCVASKLLNMTFIFYSSFMTSGSHHNMSSNAQYCSSWIILLICLYEEHGSNKIGRESFTLTQSSWFTEQPYEWLPWMIFQLRTTQLCRQL